MDRCEQHYDKYKVNREFLSIGELGTDFKPWYVTGAFYCSLHLIEGYFAKMNNISHENHIETLRDVKKNSVLMRIFRDYYTLYHESLKARYGEKVFSDEDIRNIENSLQSIETKLLAMVSC